MNVAPTLERLVVDALVAVSIVTVVVAKVEVPVTMSAFANVLSPANV